MYAGKARPFEDLFGDPLRPALRAWAVGPRRSEGQVDDRLQTLLASGGREKAGGLGDTGTYRIAKIGGTDSVKGRHEAFIVHEIADHDRCAHCFQNIGALIEGAYERANATSALEEILSDG